MQSDTSGYCYCVRGQEIQVGIAIVSGVGRYRWILLILCGVRSDKRGYCYYYRVQNDKDVYCYCDKDVDTGCYIVVFLFDDLFSKLNLYLR